MFRSPILNRALLHYVLYMHADDYPSCWATSMDDQVYIITEHRHNHLTLNILLHTQTYIYVKIAKRTGMALLQQPTEERMVSTFLTACLWYQHCVTGSLRIMNSSSLHYAYDMRKSNFPDFQGIFLYFPNFSQNLKFSWPSTKFPDFSMILNFPDFSLTCGNHVNSIPF